MKKLVFGVALLTLGGTSFFACTKLQPKEPQEHELLDGPIEGLTHEEMSRFTLGDAAFEDVFTPQKGLGPIFVANSCESCHAGDGKGHPSTALIRFGQSDEFGNKFLHLGGPQLQNRAIPGYQPEVLPPNAPSSVFIAPIVTGLGYLQYVKDEDILAMEAASHQHPDGIGGKVNWINIPDYIHIPQAEAQLSPIMEKEGKYIGRFGFKSSVYNLLQQTVIAYNQDIGIASYYDRNDVYSNELIDPEIETSTVNDVAFYLSTLKAPIQRNKDKEDIILGNRIFKQIGCEGCHKETLKTGFSPVKALAYKTFHPYTDLLVHDMGPLLDDGYTEGSVKSSEWRTAPLWGLGLAKESQGGAVYLMHDGRARSITEAINLHGGTSAKSRARFNQLNQKEKKLLTGFLESL